jgi:spoIIIJ-associated protein
VAENEVNTMAEREFFGASEQEAAEQAAQELGIPRENLLYSVLETKKKGFFTKGGVRISVEVKGETDAIPANVSDEIASQIVSFLKTLIQKMGFEGSAVISSNSGNRLMVDIKSPDSSLLIGKMGKTLDALQVVVNIVAQNLTRNALKVILDCENYRERRERKILDFAEEVADHVRQTKSSRLLEPMNPYERRLVHTALTRFEDIETISEGEGLYKQIRIRFRGRRN